jgi:hypothetical protein
MTVVGSEYLRQCWFVQLVQSVAQGFVIGASFSQTANHSERESLLLLATVAGLESAEACVGCCLRHVILLVRYARGSEWVRPKHNLTTFFVGQRHNNAIANATHELKRVLLSLAILWT